jgi:phosphoglycerol transferase MdoB-like AlkP superfamily enzyme
MIPAEKAQRSSLAWPDEKDSAVQKAATNDGTFANIGNRLVLPTIPAKVRARLLVLFLALAGIKVALLVRLGKGLFETHWRLEAPTPAWGDYILFALFVVLGFLSVLKLHRHCAAAGVKAIRAANVTLFCFGLLFILLTFHTQGKNYLYPILSGILDWNSLVPYLSLDFFFQPPFLGAWIFAYALTYYFLARSGRESWALYLTAAFGAVYAGVALRDLSASRDELLVVDCLGLASLLVGWNPSAKVAPVWFAIPLAWCVFLAAELFWFTPPEVWLAATYFRLLVYASTLLFAGATLIAFRRGFGRGWSGLLLFYLFGFLLLASRNYPIAINFNHVICLGLKLPHYFVGEILVVGFLALVAMGWAKIFPRVRFWWLDVLSIALIALAFIDFRLCQLLAVRLGWDILALGGTVKMMWRMAKPYLPGALAAVAGLAIVYRLAVAKVRKWFESARDHIGDGSSPSRNPGLIYAATAFLLLGLLGVLTAAPDKAEGQAALRLAQTSPVWKRAMAKTMKPEDFLRTAQALGMGELNATVSAPASPKSDLNVVLVFMESSYNKHLSLFGGSEDTQPLLSKYRDRMELYPNFFSSFASSIHARFATFTSLYPVRDYNAFTLEHVPVKSIFEVLHDNDYSCSLFYSSFLDYTGFRNFLANRGFDAVYDADTMPGERKTEAVSWGLREEETLAAMQNQIKAYAASKKRFFLTYVPAAPHYPYDKMPDRFHKYKIGEMGDYSPLYLNELLYMDWVLASIVGQLEESGLLDHTLVIITNDHGEMLGQHGGPIGHGFMLSPELVNTPLIIMDPRKPGYRINSTIGSQIDLLPTTLELLGIPVPADQLYEGRSLASVGDHDQRFIYLSSMQQFGVIQENRLMLGDRDRDNGALTGVFSIANEGAKTVFSEDPGSAKPPVSIKQFDDFQENLLRNYSQYRDAVCKTRVITVQR